MIKKLLITYLLALPCFVMSQTAGITVGTNTSDTTEVCNGSSLNISATTSGISNITGYSWQITSGSGSSNQSGISFTFTPSSLGTHTVSLTVFGSDTVSKVSYVEVTAPLGSVTISSVGNVNGQTLCNASLSGTINASVSGGGNSLVYNWEKKESSGIWTSVGTNSSQLIDNTQLTENTEYRLTVVNNALGCSNVVSNVLSYTVYPALTPPVVSSAQMICNNSAPIDLQRTAASGGDGSFSYEWQESSDNSSWSSIANSSNASFNPGNLTQDMYYRVLVTDGCSNAASNTVLIDVYDPINAGTLSALDDEVCYDNGTSVSLSGTSGGDGNYTRLWEISTDGVNFSTITGETGTSINTSDILTDRYYRLTVSSGCGVSDVSNIVHVQVADEFILPSISYTGDLLICYEDDPSVMTMTPTGGRTPYTFSWQKKATSSTTWSTIANSNNSSFTEASGLTLETDYRVLVTSSDGCGTLISSVQTIDVRDELTAPSISSGQTICHNTDASLTRGSASGADGNYNYDWEVSSDNTNFTSISNSNVTINSGSLTQDTYYRVKVSNALCGSEKLSVSSLVSVRDPLDAGTLSALDDEICYSSLTSLNANSVTGADGNYTYQWQYQDNGTNTWTPTGSANSSSLSTGILTEDRSYRVIVNSGCNVTDITNTVLVDVANEFTIGTIQNSGDDTICYNTTPSTLTITGTGGRSPYSYQWQRKASNNSTWVNVGSNSSSFTEVTNQTESVQYRVVQTSADGCGSLVSDVYEIIVRPDVVPPTISSDIIICHNTSTNLSRGNSSGANGLFTYEWQVSSDNSIYTSTTQSSSLISTGTLLSTKWYRVQVSNALCSVSKLSSPVRVKVRDELSSGSLATSDNQICFNSNTSLTLSNTDGADTNYTYSWQYNEGSSGWVNFGASATTVTSPNHASDVNFRVIVGSGCGVNDTTSELTVDVADSMVIGNIVNLGLDTICYNTLPSTLSISGSGGRSPYTYQWQRKPLVGGTWSNVGTNSSTFNETTTQTSSVQYRVLLTSQDGCGTLISSPFTIIVRPDLTAPSISSDLVICHNTNTTLNRGTAAGSNGVFTYQWQKSSDGVNFTSLSQSGQSYNTGNLTATQWYRVLSTNSLCNTSILSNAVRVKVRDTLFAGTISIVDDEICFNTSASLSLSGTAGADTNYSYDWQFNENGAGWTSFSTSSNNVTSPQHKENVDYRVIVNSGCNVPANSNVLTATVSDSLISGNISVFEDSVCYGSTPMQMSIVGNVGGYTPYSYDWERRIGISGAWASVSTTGATYQESDSTLEDTFYRVSITSDQGCGTVTTPVQKFRVNALPGDDSWAILGPNEVCSGANGVNYQLSSNYNTGTLSWSISNASLSNTTLTKLFADFDNLGQISNDTLEVVLTSNRTTCQRTIRKPIVILEESSPEVAQIVQKTGTNILICSDTTEGIKYHWGYIPKSTGIVQLMPGATGRYFNFNSSLDTINNVYFVRTSFGTCHTFSYFGTSSNPLDQEETNLDLILYPNPTSRFINIESSHSIERVWLMESSGRSIPLIPRNNRIEVPVYIPSGFYVLIMEIEGALVQKKIIIDRR